MGLMFQVYRFAIILFKNVNLNEMNWLRLCMQGIHVINRKAFYTYRLDEQRD